MKKSGFYSAGFYITNHTVRVFSFFRNEFCPFHSNHDEGNQDEVKDDTRYHIGDCAGIPNSAPRSSDAINPTVSPHGQPHVPKKTGPFSGPVVLFGMTRRFPLFSGTTEYLKKSGSGRIKRSILQALPLRHPCHH